MTLARAFLVIALVVSVSCVMIMLGAARSGTVAARLALTEPAAGIPGPQTAAPESRHDASPP
ncbi:MAG TPA: hypothetical protein PKX87_08135 [Alphaproteobacteria bacterium]|nr:hypothetical protein [Alphaproteobacteria bacterium]